MKRRTYGRLQAETQPEHHHSVYMALLNSAVSESALPRRQPKATKKAWRLCGDDWADPGGTLCQPQSWHQGGLSGQTHGLRLLPELYEHPSWPAPTERIARALQQRHSAIGCRPAPKTALRCPGASYNAPAMRLLGVPRAISYPQPSSQRRLAASSGQPRWL